MYLEVEQLRELALGAVLRAEFETDNTRDDGAVELFLAEWLAVNEVRVQRARKAVHNPPERVRLELRRVRELAF